MTPETYAALERAAADLLGFGLRLALVGFVYQMARFATQDQGIRLAHIAGLLLIPAMLVGMADYNRDRDRDLADDDPIRLSVTYYADDGPPTTTAERIEKATFLFTLMVVPAAIGLAHGHREYRRRPKAVIQTV